MLVNLLIAIMKKEHIWLGLWYILIAFPIFYSNAFAQTYKYFHIYDVAHSCYLAAGASYDGHVYHLRADNLGDNAQWRFVAADSGYYYLVDRRHGAALSITGQITTYTGDARCQWRAEPATTVGAYWFKNRQNGLAVVGGDVYDGKIYIQAPGERRNAQWVLRLVEDGTIGPDFYVTKQELLKIDLDTNAVNRIEVPPLFAVNQVVTNGTSVEQTTSIEARKTETTTESWEFSKSVSISVAISVKSGVTVSGVAEVSSEVTTTYQESYTWTNKVEISKTTEYLWTIPVTVPANNAVRVTAMIKKYTTQVPFNAIVRSTYGDGTVETDTVHGTWYGVEYITGAVTFEDVSAIHEKPTTFVDRPVLHSAWKNHAIVIDACALGEYHLGIYDVVGRLKSFSSGFADKPFTTSYRIDCAGTYIVRLITNGHVYQESILAIR
jgi:hypothetical protein